MYKSQGQDRTGAPGGDFFTIASPWTGAATTNTGNAQLTAAFSATGALTGSDYDVRADKIQTFRIDHNDPSATFVFGCWSKLPDFGDFDRADSLWIIPGNSPLRVCEVTLGRAGKATCY